MYITLKTTFYFFESTIFGLVIVFSISTCQWQYTISLQLKKKLNYYKKKELLQSELYEVFWGETII